MNFHIVSDSSCDLGRERLQQLGVDMVSYYVALGDEVSSREERDISTHDFYRTIPEYFLKPLCLLWRTIWRHFVHRPRQGCRYCVFA